MPRATLGSISTATLKSEDLIPVFVAEIRRIRGRLPGDLFGALRSYNANPSYDVADDLLDDLSDALSHEAPPYCYFGSHPGDGADFGFWLCEDWRQQFDEDATGDMRYATVADTSQVPAGFTGTVLHVNDHGNATLYSARKGKLTEIWSVV